MEKVLVICGPTAVGTSELAIYLAKKYNGEIINGDSMQVYREMNIGTAKVSEQERKEVPHHLFDIKTIKEHFSVAEFQGLVRAKISEITSRGNLPIIVGGTGLYLKASLYDYDFQEKEKRDYGLTKKTTEELYDILIELDEETAKTIHMNNRRRIIRAIEIFYETGVGKVKHNQKQKQKPIYDVFFLGLSRPRDQLYQMINQRVDLMFEKGLEKEARYVLENADPKSTALQAIGYKEFLSCQDSELCKETIKLNSRHLAKRQQTWFNNQFSTQWIDVQDKSLEELFQEVNILLKEWLK